MSCILGTAQTTTPTPLCATQRDHEAAVAELPFLAYSKGSVSSVSDDNDIDIMCLCETWETSEIYLSVPFTLCAIDVVIQAMYSQFMLQSVTMVP
jgi:hypothetical protein